eukprot:scaffold412_cov311-Pavlova_lutheri.AAC.16
MDASLDMNATPTREEFALADAQGKARLSWAVERWRYWSWQTARVAIPQHQVFTVTLATWNRRWQRPRKATSSRGFGGGGCQRQLNEINLNLSAASREGCWRTLRAIFVHTYNGVGFATVATLEELLSSSEPRSTSVPPYGLLYATRRGMASLLGRRYI